jgi:hypothetical protein
MSTFFLAFPYYLVLVLFNYARALRIIWINTFCRLLLQISFHSAESILIPFFIVCRYKVENTKVNNLEPKVSPMHNDKSIK